MANSQKVGLSGTPPDPNVRFFVYLDESNFRLSGEAENKKRRGLHPKAPLSWHYDIRVLKGIIRKHSGMSVDEKLTFMVYGSNLEHGLVYQDLELHTSKVTTFTLPPYRREKQVDTSLVDGMSVQTLNSLNARKSAVFAVISGDSDMLPTVNRATEYGHSVHVWAWKDSVSNKYRDLERDGRINLTLLDGFLDALTMRSSSILIRDISIPPDGVVFPNPWQRSPDVLERIRKDLPDGNIFFIKRSNDWKDCCTDVGILHDSGVLDQDVFLRRILKNLQDEGLHVMSFAEYFRASDEFELCAKLGTHLLGCFPNFFWARPLEALRFGNR
ncbi:hypothetical protein FBULB1_6112 [Fusarium bulbicola]|nr:hypothetical protein FBULB1_6112 [Fusarium bulbicola]